VTLTWWLRGDPGGVGRLVVEWSGTVVLTTPRLLLRTFRRDDLPLYAALNADPEVARYLGGR
jgi:RimJ/RimL family protein N-acetyltransferase